MEINTGYAKIQLTGDRDTFHGFLSAESPESGILYVTVRIRSDQREYPPVYRLEWSHPSTDIQSLWYPGSGQSHRFMADWDRGLDSTNTSQAPVLCLKNLEDRNRLTFAFSDAANPVAIKAGLHEEDSMFRCSVTLFEKDSVPIDRYEATLRIDTREIPYYDAIRSASDWWLSALKIQPLHVPEEARLPMYSTWYSFHQELTSEALERQCAIAKTLGCSAVIVDDGWQTSDNNRGYAFTGDWNFAADKIPDVKKHVDAIHQLGMKYMLWFSVPFVGENSRAWGLFKNQFLSVNKHLHTGILDPRFPEVRNYLLDIYQKAVSEWNVDGLKLDFVDCFRSGEASLETGGGRDYESLSEAVDALFSQMIQRLRRINPELLIEFRQSYIGPLMRKFGNMFRAGDCPNDMVQNRVSTLDLRLLSGTTAVHSDMIMFHPDESPENAALQLINVLFAVPQISVKLDSLTEPQRQMLRFWLSFFIRQRDVLQNGDIAPFHPELCYPAVEASAPGKQIFVAYSDFVLPLFPRSKGKQIQIVNGSRGEAVALEAKEDLGHYEMKIINCLGQTVFKDKYRLSCGLHRIAIPQSGLAVLQPA